MFLALVLFVGIHVLGTGAWTGILASSMLQLALQAAWPLELVEKIERNNTMNKKKIILLFILTLVGILCVFLNGKEEPEIGVGQNKVSFSNKTNSFYYDQLDETEKRVCNDITALVEQGNGGKIDLTAPISTYRYLRIVRTLSFDPEYQNWAISLIIPVGENNKLIDRNTINDDCNIMKLYVLVNDSKKRKELKNFKLVLNDENIITNIDELEKICKSADFSTEYAKNARVL